MLRTRRRLRILLVLAASTFGRALAAEPDCKPQSQVDVTQLTQQVVLIGEVHGTNEIPAFGAGLVCSLLKAGRSVILAVEHDGEEQDAMNRYLESSGSFADRQRVMQGRTWKTYSDGRGSAAMFALIESMRTLRQAGQRLGVLAFRQNDNLEVPMEPADRAMLTAPDNVMQNRLGDLAMANNVQYAAILYRRYVVVVLSGYSHASTVLSVSKNPMFGTYSPMGKIVSDAMPTFVIGIDTEGGSHWSGDKARPIDPGPLAESGARIDATAHVGRLTPSPPARELMSR